MIDFFADFETFHDVGYSLRSPKISMTDYIHDDRFEMLGVSVAENTNTPIYIHKPDVKTYFDDLRKHSLQMRLIAHNCHFDGYILSDRLRTVFGEYFDTFGLVDFTFQGGIGRGLDEIMRVLLGRQGKDDIIKEIKGLHYEQLTADQLDRLARYANEDLIATQQFYHMYSSVMPDDERKIMDIIMKMFIEPKLEFDSALLQVALKEAQDDRDERIAGALRLFDCTEDDLRGDRFLGLIEEAGGTVPYKPSPSVEGKMIPALAKTDPGFQAMLESDDDSIRLLCEARLAVKSTQALTRVQRMIDLDNYKGKCPVCYNYYRAHTGRVSGGNKTNFANLKRGSNLRKSIQAPEGYVMVVCDSGQIECRDVNYLAKNDYMLDLFKSGKDPYNAMAADIFKRPIDRKKPEDEVEGFIGKTATLGLGFQMGGPKFKWTCETGAKVQLGREIDVPLEQAYYVVDVYRSRNVKVKQFWDLMQEWLGKMVGNGPSFTYHYGDGELLVEPKENKIWFPNETYLYYPALSFDNGNFSYVAKEGKRYKNKKIYGGLLTENIVQKHSRDIVSWQMLKIAERYDVVLHTYDENVIIAPEAEADEAYEFMYDIMTTAPEWAKGIPLKAEGGWAKEYSK